MSGYLNRVQLIGNLGQDPEVRSTQAGKKIVTLSIATSESWNDPQSGERRGFCQRSRRRVGWTAGRV